jgi:hypothetical protein
MLLDFAPGIGPIFDTRVRFRRLNQATKRKVLVSLPTVFLSTGAVTVIPPTTNADGTPVTPGEILSYTVGVRSLTVSGTAAGTYTFTGGVTPPSLSITLKALGVTSADSYAAAASATTAAGTTAFGPEASFTVAPSLPNPPTVTVA